MTEIKKESATINGVSVTDLSVVGQGFFDKLMDLKKEADTLATQYQIQQAGILAFKAVAEGEEALSEGETLSEYLNKKAEEFSVQAQKVYSQHEQKQAALKEISNMITEEVNQVREAQEAEVPSE